MGLAVDIYGSLITLPDNDKSYVETWDTDVYKRQIQMTLNYKSGAEKNYQIFSTK